MRQSFPYLQPFFMRLKGLIALLSVTLFAQAVLILALPWPFRFVVDKLVTLGAGAGDKLVMTDYGEFSAMNLLIYSTAIFCGLGILHSVFHWFEGRLATKMMMNLFREVREDLFQKIMTRKQSYLGQKKKIDLLGRVSSDVSKLEILVTQGMAVVIRSLPTLVLVIGMMLYLNWELTLLFLVFLPPIYLMTYFFTRKMRVHTRNFRNLTNSFEEEAHQAFLNLDLIKSLTGEKKVIKTVTDKNDGLIDAYEGTRDNTVAVDVSMLVARVAVRAALLFIGTAFIFNGEITMGDLLLFIFYLEAVTWPINDLTRFMSKWAKAVVSIERLEYLANELEGKEEREGEREVWNDKKFEINFNNVTFGYIDGSLLLENFTERFRAGSIYALVGPSGAGKSTFISHLNRLLDPVEGQVELNQLDMKGYRLRSLRQKLRVISQDSFLISGTVRENLLIACENEVEDEDLWFALSKVNADDFVKLLPRGLDTIIGEGGQNLSGGQKRRISLARAFLQTDAEVFVFDEPTAGLDTLSAQVVMNSLKELIAVKSIVFFATHRLDEVSISDSVVFFQKGKNPRLENHESLMQSEGLYRSLFEEKEGHA